MKYYVEKPDLRPYEGKRVDEKTHFTFKNDKVDQKLENFKFVSIYTTKTPKFTTTTKIEINLDKGDVLLFESENRGWFLPSDTTPVEEIKDAINDYRALTKALTK